MMKSGSRTRRATGVERLGALCRDHAVMQPFTPVAVNKLVDEVLASGGPGSAEAILLFADFSGAVRPVTTDDPMTSYLLEKLGSTRSAIVDALNRGGPFYLTWLNQRDPTVVTDEDCDAVELLSFLPALAADIRAAIYPRLPYCPRWRHLSRLCMAGERISAGFDDWRNMLEDLFGSENDASRRFVLACFLARISSGPIAPDLVEAIVSGMNVGPDVFVDACSSAKPAVTTQVLERIGSQATMLQSPAMIALVSLTEKLVRHMLGDTRTGWTQSVDKFTPGTRQIVSIRYPYVGGIFIPNMEKLSRGDLNILRALSRIPILWTFETNLWSLFGLPSKPEQLRQLCETLASVVSR